MNVPKLLHKLRVVANIEIVVPLLPEMLRIANQTPRYSLLQGLQPIRQSIPKPDRWPIQAIFWLEWGSLRFTEQKVNMLRHDDIPVNAESVTTPHPLQSRLEDSTACLRGKQATAVVTAECDEMTLPAVLKTH